MRASYSVWWPGVSKEVEEFVQACPTCQKTTGATADHTFTLVQMGTCSSRFI